jgi:hypothetical protein
VRAFDALVLLPGRLVLQSLVDAQQHAGALSQGVRAAEGEVELFVSLCQLKHQITKNTSLGSRWHKKEKNKSKTPLQERKGQLTLETKLSSS